MQRYVIMAESATIILTPCSQVPLVIGPFCLHPDHAYITAMESGSGG